MPTLARETYDDARDADKAKLDRERIRLWYVAATRARALLVLPRLDAAPSKSAWNSLLDLSHLPPDMGAAPTGQSNLQTQEFFAAEAPAVADSHRRLT